MAQWHQDAHTHTHTHTVTADSWKCEKNTNQGVKTNTRAGARGRGCLSARVPVTVSTSLNASNQHSELENSWADKKEPWKIRGSERGFTISVTSVWCSLKSLCSDCLSMRTLIFNRISGERHSIMNTHFNVQQHWVISWISNWRATKPAVTSPAGLWTTILTQRLWHYEYA